jgi:hypothetical protein
MITEIVPAKLDEQHLAVAPTGSSMTSGIEGEIDSEDFSLSYISLCQKSGDLSENFKPGNFVFGKAIDLGTAVKVIPVKATKFYEEDVPYGEGTGRKWFRRVEIPEGAPFRGAANIDFLVQVPQSVSALSVLNGEEIWACARYVVRGSSYPIFKLLITDSGSGFFKNGMWTRTYELQSERKSNDKGSWFAPRMISVGPTEASLAANIASTLKL